jgi:hypothetical protein
MNDQEIIHAFLQGKCSDIEDKLSDCELLYRQYRKSLKGICSCRHNGIRNKFKNIVRKNIKRYN